MVRSTLPPPERLQYHLSTEAKRGGLGLSRGGGGRGGLSSWTFPDEPLEARACTSAPRTPVPISGLNPARDVVFGAEVRRRASNPAGRAVETGGRREMRKLATDDGYAHTIQAISHSSL